MRRLLATLAVFAALAASPAFASGHGAGGEKKPDEKGGDPGRNVEMPFLIAPLNVDGKLYGYAYISPKVVTTSAAASLEVREKLAFIQDLYVRDVNSMPVAKADDPHTVDERALVVRLLADTRKIIGGNKIVKVMLVQVQISPIRPDQAVAASAAAAGPDFGGTETPPEKKSGGEHGGGHH